MATESYWDQFPPATPLETAPPGPPTIAPGDEYPPPGPYTPVPLPTTTTTNSSSTSGSSGADFGNAWIASGGKPPADLRAFTDQWNSTHPQNQATISGSKMDKVTIDGRTYDAVISAGTGGTGASWTDVTDGSSGGPD